MLRQWFAPDRTDPDFESSWRSLVKVRALVVLAICGVWAVVVEARLVQLQVFQHQTLSERAETQQERVVKVSAPRGDIIDRNGRILAYSVAAQAIAADPSKIGKPAAIAAQVCGALQDCTPDEQAEIVQRLSAKKREFAWIRRARNVSPTQAARVAELKLPGVTLVDEARRYYPNRDLAAHVLGFVGTEDEGLSGVEQFEDEQLRGRNGQAFVQVDARLGRLQTQVDRAPVPGATVELTIDLTLQHIAERELRAGVQRSGAKAGTVIIMEPRTGDVLALANYPTFNPNAYGRFPAEVRRNRAIQEVYEPGSTFKVVTASAAIEEGVIGPGDLVDCSPGYLTLPGRKPIRDVHPYGVLTFEDVIVKSSNVGAIRVGQRLGAERLSRYVRRFGFGAPIAPDFIGESRGVVHDELNDSGLASVSMGYQISVTPVQMAAAVSAVANGGELMEPHLVRAVIRDGRRLPTDPKVLRRSIAPETAAILTRMMEGVVERGTAKRAALDRFRVAGKTGTTEKIVDGQYSETDHNASFVGFVPSGHPALTILVVIDTPREGGHYGGDAAAPVFKQIAAGALQHLGVRPTVNPIPPVLTSVATTDPAVLPVRATQPVVHMDVEPGIVPDVSGLGIRDALRLLTRAGLIVRPAGSGVVVSQSPLAGTPVAAGGLVKLELRRSPEDRPTSTERR